MLKPPALALTLMLASSALPLAAQQTQIYQVCTNYQENYNPGFVDSYGNYIPGNVNSQAYNVRCGYGGAPYGGGYYQAPQGNRRRCSAATTTLGGLLGGGVAAALSKPDAYGWSVPLGAVLGMGAAQTGCY